MIVVVGNLGPILVIMGLFWVAIAIYVYGDASNRNKDATWWFVFTLIFGVVALVIYSISITPVESTGSDESSTSDSPGGLLEDTDHDRPEAPLKDMDYDRSWSHEYLKQNYNDDQVVRVFDSENTGVFVVGSEIRPNSAVYRRKYGSDWVEDATEYLAKSFGD